MFLAILARSESTPLEIAKLHAERTSRPQKELISVSSRYHHLEKLREAGFADYRLEERDGRSVRVYFITAPGRRVLCDKRREVLELADQLGIDGLEGSTA